MKLLLARNDVNPDRPRNDGRTPFQCASYGGHERVVELLLASNYVDPDTPSQASMADHSGALPLMGMKGR